MGVGPENLTSNERLTPVDTPWTGWSLGEGCRQNAGRPVTSEFGINNEDFFRIIMPPHIAWELLRLKRPIF